MLAFYWIDTCSEELYDLLVERVKVLRTAARYQFTIFDNFLIDPISACISKVRFQGRPRGQCSTPDYIGFDQHPGSMANG